MSDDLVGDVPDAGTVRELRWHSHMYLLGGMSEDYSPIRVDDEDDCAEGGLEAPAGAMGGIAAESEYVRHCECCERVQGANEEGWRFDTEGNDFCPDCSAVLTYDSGDVGARLVMAAAASALATLDDPGDKPIHPLIQSARGAITDGDLVRAGLLLAEAADAAKDLEDAYAASVPADWHGLMRILDAHYPADVFTGESGGVGARLVVALRELDRYRSETEPDDEIVERAARAIHEVYRRAEPPRPTWDDWRKAARAALIAAGRLPVQSAQLIEVTDEMVRVGANSAPEFEGQWRPGDDRIQNARLAAEAKVVELAARVRQAEAGERAARRQEGKWHTAWLQAIERPSMEVLRFEQDRAEKAEAEIERLRGVVRSRWEAVDPSLPSENHD